MNTFELKIELPLQGYLFSEICFLFLYMMSIWLTFMKSRELGYLFTRNLVQYYRNLALAESLQPRIRKFLNSFAFNNSFQLNALLLVELNIWHYASNFI